MSDKESKNGSDAGSDGGSDDEKETVEFLWEGNGEEWTHDHIRLIYIMSRYAVQAHSSAEKEGWVRQVILHFFLFPHFW